MSFIFISSRLTLATIHVPLSTYLSTIFLLKIPPISQRGRCHLLLLPHQCLGTEQRAGFFCSSRCKYTQLKNCLPLLTHGDKWEWTYPRQQSLRAESGPDEVLAAELCRGETASSLPISATGTVKATAPANGLSTHTHTGSRSQL